MRINKLCSKEKIGRLLLGLILLLLASFLVFLGIVPRLIGFFVGLYLVITAVMGFCMLFAIFKE